MANDEFSISGITSSKISNDLSEVQIVLKTGDGKRCICKATPDILARLMIGLSDIVQQVRNQMLARGGELAIAALEVDGVAASSPVGGGKVILSIDSKEGIVHHFALPPGLSAILRSQMQKAEESARQPSSRTRQ